MERLVRKQVQLTYSGAAVAIQAAIAKALEISVPQCISVVDAGGNLLAFARMSGARLLAQHSSFAKAQSAISIGGETGHAPAQFGVDLALATGGRSINLLGGLPIVLNGEVVGAIGVGSGKPEEDFAVAEAAREAVLNKLREDAESEVHS